MPTSETDIQAQHPRDAQAGPESAGKAARLGRGAETPGQIPFAGWKMVLKRTFAEMISDRIGLAAAGCAFYATLALFPTISTLISIYGLVFDPQTVEPQMAALRHVLPGPAYSLIAERIHTLVSKPPSALTISLIISIMITLWSSSAGTKSIISALNIAYEEKEGRSFVRFQATALSMTLGAILGAIMTLVLLIFLPAAIEFLPERLGWSWASDGLKRLLQLATPLILVVFVGTAFSLLYRFGPSRRPARWHWITPGSLAATLLWVSASAAFSYYVGHIATYDATYGPLGAVVAIMMWFYVTAFVVLLGAELNAELELQTAKDSTLGGDKPIGERGAYVADHVSGE